MSISDVHVQPATTSRHTGVTFGSVTVSEVASAAAAVTRSVTLLPLPFTGRRTTADSGPVSAPLPRRPAVPPGTTPDRLDRRIRLFLLFLFGGVPGNTVRRIET